MRPQVKFSPAEETAAGQRVRGHGVQLFMTELTVSDFPAAVAWYQDVLGLPVRLIDEPNRFALFEAGGRLALRGGASPTTNVLVHLEVADLSAELHRLAAHGVTADEPKTSAEGYRRAIVSDPTGNRLGLFEWVRPTSPDAPPG